MQWKKIAKAGGGFSITYDPQGDAGQAPLEMLQERFLAVGDSTR